MPLYNREKPVRSVAAFLWMPQLHLSFHHMSFLAPLFVRILANSFVQAGLLPRNHLALLYGAEGVEKQGIKSVIGDAWFHLRNTRATADQWGFFWAVMLMIAMIIGSCVTFIMTIGFGFGATAQAQLFSNPNGDSAFPTSYSPQGAFDTGTNIPSGYAAGGDYGIMMLDKVIRAGAYGKGTPIQNATRSLMEVYNSGVLVIASVIIFWMIINVVIDTAKTGQVGGGRHNMVWAPIRIVFALALLIPLGSAGYSSGQYMVMKVAEWGSNFGSRAWVAYVQGVLNDKNVMIKDEIARDSTQIVFDYQQMWVCRAAVNAELASGGNDAADSIVRTVSTSRDDADVYRFTSNSEERNLCGTLSFEKPVDISGYTRFFAEPLTIAGIQFNNTMRQNYKTKLLALESQAKQYACNYISHSTTLNNMGADCGGSPVADGAFPKDRSGIENMQVAYGRDLQAVYDSAFAQFKGVADREIINGVKERGWAGMGVWYHKIAQLNEVVHHVHRPTVQYQKGDMLGKPTEKESLWSSLFGSQWQKNAQTDLKAFDLWWNTPVEGAAQREDLASPMTDSSDVSMPTFGGDAAETADRLFSAIDPTGLRFKYKVREIANDTENYPLANLTKIGTLIAEKGAAIIGWVIVLQTLLKLVSVATGFVSGGIDFSNYVIFPFLNQIGGMLIGAGFMLMYYVPLIPFIRVAFSILTWIISVFEAVAMVPIAALAHLSTQGEGLAGSAQHVWKLWLNILMRPIMTVIGFVGAMLVFNGFISFINSTFLDEFTSGPNSGMLNLLGSLALLAIYVFVMYTVANTVFKMLDLVPDHMMKWIGGPAGDRSFDHDNMGGALAAQSLMSRLGGGMPSKPHRERLKDEGKLETGATKTNENPPKE